MAERGPGRTIHVLWSPQTGPICAYSDQLFAGAHAKTMLGVQVAAIEVRAELPEIARVDLETEFNEEFEDETPVDEVPFEEIDDAVDTKIVDVDEKKK